VLNTVLALLAVKAKTIALVAATAVVTAGAVGGGAVAVRAVTSESASVRADVATPTVGLGQRGDARGAERRSDTATAVLTGDPAAPAPAAGCDPNLSHGQNVSAYARSLPKGPGRGALVSAFAQSDCGKKTAGADGTDDKTAKPAKPAKPAKTAKTARAANAAKAAHAAKAARARAAKAAKAAEVAKAAKAGARPADVDRGADAPRTGPDAKNGGKGGGRPRR